MSNKRWYMLALVILVSTSFMFSVQAAPPLIPAIINDFSLSYTTAAGIMLFVALPAMFLSIPGGFLADKYGNKRLSTIGLGLVCLGTFCTAIAPSFPLLQGGRVIVGIGGALLRSAAPPLIFQWFRGKELGLAMGIWALNLPLATTLSFNLLGRAELAYGWRTGFWIATAFAITILILFTIFVEEKKVSRAIFSLSVLKKSPIWILAFIWGTFSMTTISLTTWGKTLFMEFKGIPPVQADFLASLLMLLGLVTPLTGYIAGRLGKPRLLILLAIMVFITCLVILPGAGQAQVTLLLVVLGIFTSLAPPCIFSLPPELVGQDNAGVGFGVLNATQNFGIVIGPLLVGLVLDITYNEMLVFFTMAFFAAIGLLFTFILKVR